MNILELLNLSFLNQNSEAVEIFLRNASFSTLFISMMFYWIQTAFSSTKKTTSPLIREMELSQKAQPSGQLAMVRTATLPLESKFDKGNKSSFVLQSKGGGFLLNTKGVLPTEKEAHKLPNFGTITMILSNILLVCLLIFRWKESGHFPLSNLYESLMFLSWSCTCIHLILDQVVKTAVVRLDATLVTKLIGSITSPSALFTNAFATFSLPPEMQKASPLVPALQSNWLMMHVTVMIISYSALILGSLLSIAFLILISANPSSSSLASNNSSFPYPVPSSVPPFPFEEPSPFGSSTGGIGGGGEKGKRQGVLLFSAQEIQVPLSLNNKQEALLRQKTKNDLAWNFDNLSYRVLGIGFPFLTIGILSGAVWANEAWGSYWSWDPKETWALLTWLIFAIYLHARITKGWQGKKPAIIASFGFLVIWICFLGVNLIGSSLGPSLHSYGFFVQP